MLWVALLLLHLVGIVGYTILLRRSALTDINKYVLAALMQSFIFLPTLVFLITGSIRTSFNFPEWTLIIAAGFTIAGLHLTAIKALQKVEASVFTLIYNLRLVFTAILGVIFFSEVPTFLQIVGGLLIFSSVLVLELHKDKKLLTAPILYALLATVWLSFHSVLEKHNVTTAGFANYMFYSGLIASLLLWSLALRKGFSYVELKKHIDKKFLLLLFFRPLSAWSLVMALKYGPLAVAHFVSGMSAPLVVIAGALFLKERDDLRAKIIAASISVVGFLCILLSQVV